MVDLTECRDGHHDLIIIFQQNRLNDAEPTVRWCRKCGAVVVDADRDGRAYPGRIMEMTTTSLYRQHKEVGNDSEEEYIYIWNGIQEVGGNEAYYQVFSSKNKAIKHAIDKCEKYGYIEPQLKKTERKESFIICDFEETFLGLIKRLPIS